jgi:hypothetical protein
MDSYEKLKILFIMQNGIKDVEYALPPNVDDHDAKEEEKQVEMPPSVLKSSKKKTQTKTKKTPKLSTHKKKRKINNNNDNENNNNNNENENNNNNENDNNNNNNTNENNNSTNKSDNGHLLDKHLQLPQIQNLTKRKQIYIQKKSYNGFYHLSSMIELSNNKLSNRFLEIYSE